MTEPFSVRVTVRGYEIDAMGHLNSGVYLQFAEHARWELLRSAGVDPIEMLAAGVGPVNLETTIRFQRELRYGNDADITCAFVFGEGKSFKIEQEIRHADGVVAATVTNVGGLIDVNERRLVARPGERFREFAKIPELLGL